MTVVVRWGASSLAVEQLEPLRPASWVEGRVAIEVDEGGAWARCDGERRPIDVGSRFTLRGDALAIEVDARADEGRPAWSPEVDGRKVASHAFSLGLHASLLAVLFVLRPAVTEDLDLDALRESLRTAPIPMRDVVVQEEAEDSGNGAPGKGEAAMASSVGPGASLDAARGARHAVQAGQNARGTERAAPATPPDPTTFGVIGLLASAHEHGPGEVDPWIGEGRDAGSSWGDAWSTGDGLGGLSLSGIGEGGGSHSAGIPLGGLGLSGAGFGGTCDDTCAGNGLGHGRSMGHGMGSHSTKPPTIRLCGSTDPERRDSPCINTSGRLPPQAIQRVVRQNFGRFRLCYENVLRAQPSLSARVSVSFVIARDGAVSSVSGSGDEPALSSCVTKAFYGLSFPSPEGGSVRVTYPITFSPAG